MQERSHLFNIRDKNHDEIQGILENIVEKQLSLSTKAKRLGRSLLRINYFDNNVDMKSQKDNRITILLEQEKRIYVQINGNLSDSQISKLWKEFEENLNKISNIENIEKLKFTKDEIIEEISNLIEEKGYTVKFEDVQEFVENFTEKYHRFPKRDEINSIVKGYIIIVNEQKLSQNKDTELTEEEKNVESLDPSLESNQKDLSLTSNDNTVLIIPDKFERRTCPNCGNNGLIHEMIDKSVIILDYPKIYGKKNCCAECGHEWRVT
ncbi:MAG: hypothetical protein ACFFC3_01790 [Candidatus Odinarchaeota archaeon]